jgi:hypothetical protein
MQGAVAVVTVDRLRKLKDHMAARHYWDDTDTGGSITLLWAKSHRDEHDPAVCRSADQWTHTHDADEWVDLYEAVDAAMRPRSADRPVRECASTRCHENITSKRSDAKYCSAHCKQFGERQAAKRAAENVQVRAI